MAEVVVELRRSFGSFELGYEALMAIPSISHQPFHHFGFPEASEPGQVRARAEASLLFHQRIHEREYEITEIRKEGVTLSFTGFVISWHFDSDSVWRFVISIETSSDAYTALLKWASVNKWSYSIHT